MMMWTSPLLLGILFQKIVEDTARYNTLTLKSVKQGFQLLSSGGFLDHIVVSNELTDEYVPNSIMVYDQEQT
jgi:hypothetical protein